MDLSFKKNFRHMVLGGFLWFCFQQDERKVYYKDEACGGLNEQIFSIKRLLKSVNWCMGGFASHEFIWSNSLQKDGHGILLMNSFGFIHNF